MQMSSLDLIRSSGQIMQMAYVVADIRTSIGEWVSRLNVGPWFLLDHFTGEHPVYRGRTSIADVSIAMSFTASMNIELIQPNDQNPSVYKEHIDRFGHGFHHWGIASADVDQDAARLAAKGMELVFRAGVPTGGDVAYFTTGGTLPGYVELIQTGPLMQQVFQGFHDATIGWNGGTPIRPFL